MKNQTFSLRPLPGSLPFNPDHVAVSGSIGRRAGILSVCYEFCCPPETSSIPAPSVSPSRKYALWEETCFELFVARKNADQYWEFNVSPAGDWNVYHFASYRQGMSEETSFTALPVIVETRPGFSRIFLEVDLKKIRASEQALDAGVSAVVKTIDGKRTYWALAHPGPGADFHRRDSFVLDL